MYTIKKNIALKGQEPNSNTIFSDVGNPSNIRTKSLGREPHKN
jgi:hypothetical protein